MRLTQEQAQKLIKRRHPEWTEHQKRWRWLMDSLEGCDRYRHADYFFDPFTAPRAPWYAYGWDKATGEGIPFTFGQIVERNLVPHLSEMSVKASNIYALRLNRTKVPKYVEFVTRRYLSRIFARQISRADAPMLDQWRGDVDGRGTEVGKWMRKTVGPMLLTLGQIDLVFGHPEMDDETVVNTRADQRALGLDRCIASYILPENIVWWRLNKAKSAYVELLVHERFDNGYRWRHWIDDRSDCYSSEGEYMPECSWTHSLGRIPVIRIVDDRKLRCDWVGQSRMEDVAETQKSVYNRRSELILGDVLHSHPLLQGPEEYVTNEGEISIGPGGMMPMKRLENGSGYQGQEYLDPPSTGADSTRTHIQDDLDELMTHAGLLKPAGSTSGSTVSQSGISKSFDAREGNDLLSEIAITLQEAEEQATQMALIVLTDGTVSQAELDAVEIEYPREYDLFTAGDLAGVLADIQMIVTASGGLPETEAEVIKRLITVLLPGLDEERLGELHDEVDLAVSSKATRADQMAEAGPTELVQSSVNPTIALPPDAGQIASALNSQILN